MFGLPAALANLVETYGFSWDELEKQLEQFGPGNAYGRFLKVIADIETTPRGGGVARRGMKPASSRKFSIAGFGCWKPWSPRRR